MANSLSDQLLKAGLITQDQIDQADQDKQKQKERAKSKKQAGSQKPGKPNPKHKQRNTDKRQTAKPANKTGAQRKEASDLAKFYQQRNALERAEREAEEKRKREAAERRKKTRKQIRELISAHAQNVPEADIRFNFVVGATVKYLYVTAEQQAALGSGELSITFMDGKRCLIPLAIGEQIQALDPDKIVVNYKGQLDEDDPFADWPADIMSAQEAVAKVASDTPDSADSNSGSETKTAEVQPATESPTVTTATPNPDNKRVSVPE